MSLHIRTEHQKSQLSGSMVIQLNEFELYFPKVREIISFGRSSASPPIEGIKLPPEMLTTITLY